MSRSDPPVTWREDDTELGPTPGAEPAPDPGAPLEAPGRYGPADRAGRPSGAASIIGRGGLGVVLATWDHLLGRSIALKELRPQGDLPASTAARARFLREARITAQLEHPSIVPVHEIGRRADGTPYYTMRWVRGRTLAEALQACAGLRDRLALLGHVADVCHAVAYAHSRGVVHRDLKPDNVMVGEFGETVVLDWGLARAADEDDERIGAIFGTPAYMSPEQAAGRTDEVDARSDVWSLGVMLFEVLAGRPPFEGTSHELLARVRQETPPRLREVVPELAPDLAAIVEKALSRVRADRYPSARELARDLDAWRAGLPVSTYRYSSTERARRFVEQHRAAVATGTAALAGLAALGAVSWVSLRFERDRALEAEDLALAREAEALAALTDALVGKASAAAEAHDPIAAGSYAARALTLGERPLARGVALRTARWPTPERVAEVAVPGGCRRVAWAADLLWCGGRGGVTGVSASGSVVRTFEAHDVTAIAASADGRWLAVAEEDRVWAVDLASDLVAWEAQVPGTPLALVWDGDGLLVSATAPDRLVRLASGRVAAELPLRAPAHGVAADGPGFSVVTLDSRVLTVSPHLALQEDRALPFPAYGVHASADGRLAVAGVEGSIAVLGPGGAEHVEGAGGQGVALFSPGGEWLVDAREDGSVRLLDTARWGTWARLPDRAAAPKAVAVSPDGALLAVGLAGVAEDHVQLWRIGDPVRGDGLYGGDSWTTALTPLAGGRVLTRDRDARLDVFDVASGRRLHHLGTTVSGEGGFVVAADARTVVYLGDDRQTVVAADALDGRELARVAAPSPVRWVEASASAVLFALDDGGLARLELPSGVLVRAPESPRVDELVAEPTSDRVVGLDRSLQVWGVDPATGARTALATTPPDVPVTWFQLGPGGDSLWAGTKDGDVVAWALPGGAEVFRVHTGDRMVRRIAVSPDGALLAVGPTDLTIQLWDVRQRSLLALLEGHHNRFSVLSFQPDGRTLLTASWDGRVIPWDLDPLRVDGQELLERSARRWGMTVDGATLVPAPGPSR